MKGPFLLFYERQSGLQESNSGIIDDRSWAEMLQRVEAKAKHKKFISFLSPSPIKMSPVIISPSENPDSPYLTYQLYQTELSPKDPRTGHK